MRLRELNKQRTREAIVRVAVGLFVARGYRNTTLVDIAASAGIAPSTLHSYFRVKDDLVFSFHEAALASARQRLLDRPEPEHGVAALTAWVEGELPAVLTRYGAENLVHIRGIIDSDADLRTQERFRLALLEDVFAAAFANDLGEPPQALTARVMATIARHAIEEVYHAWYLHHATDSDVALAELTALTADHVKSLLEDSAEAIRSLPKPAGDALGA